MKLALVSGERQEAQPTLAGKCPACSQPMVAKCGEVKVWHWAHQGKRHCDPWWENETEWHRNWKGLFPVEWQEVVHAAETGEKHIADVKTDRGWVIEFQHSYLNPEERRARDAFYPKLIWVVDGTRRKRDRSQLLSAWECGVPVVNGLHLRTATSDGCTLLREWAGSNVPTFFDLGDEHVLWWLVARSTDGSAHVQPYLRTQFIDSHRGTRPELGHQFDNELHELSAVLAEYDSRRQARALGQAPIQPLRVFQQYSAPRQHRRRRF
jgi:hypothetical protein